MDLHLEWTDIVRFIGLVLSCVLFAISGWRIADARDFYRRARRLRDVAVKRDTNASKLVAAARLVEQKTARREQRIEELQSDMDAAWRRHAGLPPRERDDTKGPS